MKIWYFLNTLDRGGSEVYAKVLGDELEKLNHSIKYFSMPGKISSSLPKKKYIKTKIFYIDDRVVTIKDQIKKQILKKRNLIFPILYKEIFKLERPDIIITQHPYPSVLASYISKKYNIKVLNIVHHILPNEYSEIYNELGIKFDKYLAVSEEIQEFLRKEKKLEEVEYVLNPVEVNFKNYELKNKKKKQVTLISHIHKDKWKSVENFILSSLENSEKIIYKLYGKLGEDIKEEFYKLLKQVNFEKERVLYCGETEEVLKVIKESDIVVGVGRSAIEAAAQGRLVIISGHLKGREGGNFGGLLTAQTFKELAYNNFTGRNSNIVANPKILSDEIIKAIKILENKNFEIIINNLKNKITESISKERVTIKIEKILNEMIGGK